MKRTENKIRMAFENATPNVLDTVLSQSCEEKGTVIPMTEKKKNKFKFKEFAATAAAVVLLFGVGYFAASMIGSQGQFSQGANSGGQQYTNPLDLTAKPLDKASAEHIALKDIFKDDLEKLEYPPIVSSNLNEAQDAPYYDVEITFSNLTYNYKIDAYTGNIKNNGTVKNLSELMLTQKDALDAAIEHTGIVDLKYITELDVGSYKAYKGIMLYAISFEGTAYANEYEYTIDAYTGNIIMHSVEPKDRSDYPEQGLKNIRPRNLCIDFALEDAGFSRYDINYLDVEFENNCYNIVFFTDGRDHNYKIDAVTGEIISPAPSTPAPDGKITANMAIDFAVKHFGLQRSDVWYENYQLDNDDEFPHYDISFESGIYVYECEVGIYDPQIRDAEKEPIKDGGFSDSSQLLISLTSKGALEAAANYFNLDYNKLTNVECEIDDDDKNNIYYEISFHYGDYEYECEVDVYDGTIRNAKKELDN